MVVESEEPKEGIEKISEQGDVQTEETIKQEELEKEPTPSEIKEESPEKEPISSIGVKKEIEERVNRLTDEEVINLLKDRGFVADIKEPEQNKKKLIELFTEEELKVETSEAEPVSTEEKLEGEPEKTTEQKDAEREEKICRLREARERLVQAEVALKRCSKRVSGSKSGIYGRYF